jgi:Mn-dependent DtxR family transcriptional regulator
MRKENYRSGPGQFQYLYCFYNATEEERQPKAVALRLNVSKATVYRNLPALTEKKLLVKSGRAYALTKEGRRIAGRAHGIWDDLLFWFRAGLGYSEGGARKHVSDMFFGLPMGIVTRIAERGASQTALLIAGGTADKTLSGMAPGRHYVPMTVYKPGGDVPSMGNRGFRNPPVWIAGERGKCALELRDAKIGYTAKDGSVLRGGLARLWFLDPVSGDFTEVFEAAGRWHICGDAVKGGFEDGALVGRVRIRAQATVGTEHMPVSEADLALYFGKEIKQKDFLLRDNRFQF